MQDNRQQRLHTMPAEGLQRLDLQQVVLPAGCPGRSPGGIAWGRGQVAAHTVERALPSALALRSALEARGTACCCPNRMLYQPWAMQPVAVGGSAP